MKTQSIFQTALANGASDVILNVGSPPLFRIDGEIVPARGDALAPDQCKRLIYELLLDDQVARFESDLELDFSFSLDGITRFRGNVFQQRGSVGAAFRVIANEIPTPRELGLPRILEGLAGYPQGLILVTGPTGSGKSTTLAALLDVINRQRKCHIVTVEDPIEYLHPNRQAVVTQREVGQDTHSFAAALRHVLRQSPDVILVGEMRDLESISAALTAAETGHLVLATLHTNDTVQAVDRLLDVFPPHQQGQVRTQLSLSLLAVVAQRLVPKLGGDGRVLAAEILRNNSAVANLIREARTYQIYSVLETHAREGMVTLDMALLTLFHDGFISEAECRRRMRNPAALDGR